MAEANGTRLPEPGDERALFIVDISGYVFRAYHALPPLSTSKGEPTNATYGVTTMLLKLVRECKPARLAVAMDSKGRSFRHERYEGYKATRPAPPPDLSQQIARMRDVIDAYAVPCFQKDGIEADDIIASAVKKARAEGLRVVIVSADKDLLQLVDDDAVVMYDTMRDKVFGVRETVEKMGVPPQQVRDLLALTGDTSDNIPGVPSVGPKTAAQLLRDFGDIDGIYAAIEKIPKKALKQKLEEHRGDAYLSRDLVTLRDDLELDFDLEKLRYGGADNAKLRKLFIELEFVRLIPQVDAPAPAAMAGEYRVLDGEKAVEQALDEAREAGRIAIFTALDGGDPLVSQVCGLSIAWKEGEAAYVPIAGKGAPAKSAALLARLKAALEDPKLGKISADLKRDEIALGRVGVVLRGGELDTSLASYLLDAGRHAHSLEDTARSELDAEVRTFDQVTEKQRGSQLALFDVPLDGVVEYGGQRADVTLRVAKRLRERLDADPDLAKLLGDLELPLSHVLAKMERTGVAIDVPFLESLGAEVGDEIARLEQKCTELAGRSFNVGSPRQLESILFDELGLPVLKKTKTARSTDHEVLEELATMHELPAAILEHRSLAKLKGTYLDALPKQIDRRTGRVHTRYNQAVAATGRISSSDPNLQNIPIRTELGRRIRQAFVAEKGWEILAADYSQIELRILAHLSGDRELTEAFRTGEDVHVRTARALFGVTPETVTREQRGQAKTVNFAVIYGQTQFALARNLKIERREAKRYIDAFFAQYAGVASYLDGVVEEAKKTGEVRTILGRRRALPDLHSKNRMLRAGAERIARNTPIQGSAADIMKLAMVAIDREMTEKKLASRMILTVHDELVFEVPPSEKDAMTELVRRNMGRATDLTVPLEVDQGWGRTWGDAH